MSVTSLADTLYAFRFLKMLVTPWDETTAFELGLIDDQGKLLKKPKSQEEKDAYTVFHKLVYNIKRLLNKLPFGKSRLASYTAALFLIKEETGLTEVEIERVLQQADIDLERDGVVIESWKQRGDMLLPGVYVLEEDFANPETGEVIHLKGTKVSVSENCFPVDTMFNTHIYEVTHQVTNQSIYVTEGDLRR